MATLNRTDTQAITRYQWQSWCHRQAELSRRGELAIRLQLVKYEGEGWFLHNKETTEDIDIEDSEHFDFKQASIAGSKLVPTAEIILSC